MPWCALHMSKKAFRLSAACPTSQGLKRIGQPSSISRERSFILRVLYIARNGVNGFPWESSPTESKIEEKKIGENTIQKWHCARENPAFASLCKKYLCTKLPFVFPQNERIPLINPIFSIGGLPTPEGVSHIFVQMMVYKTYSSTTPIGSKIKSQAFYVAHCYCRKLVIEFCANIGLE